MKTSFHHLTMSRSCSLRSPGRNPVLAVAAFLVLLVLLPPGLAAAQEPPEPPDAGEDQGEAEVEDTIAVDGITITVTARKIEETLQETPISVSVLEAEDLERRSLIDISQAAEFAPNVGFDSTAPISGSSNAAAVFIRGVGQTDFTPGIDPGVGIYLDGVYLARTVGSVLNLLDVERMEILRGPQGTLFGKNTIGGALNLVSVKPHSRLEARGDLTLGYGDRVDFNGFVNVPVSERLFARASLSTLHRDGYVDRVLVGDRMGNINETVGRLAFRWLAADDFIADFSVDMSHADGESSPSTLFSTDVRTPVSPFSIGDPGTIFAGQAYNVLIGAPGPGASTLFPFLPPLPADTQPYDRRWLTDNVFETNATGPNGSSHDVVGTNVTLEWYLEGTTLKSITGYRKLNTDFGRDPDGSPLNVIHTISAIDHTQVTEEVQLIGNSFGERLHWISGLFYLNEQGDHGDIVTFADETFQIYASEGVPIDNFLFIDGPKSENDIDSFALFGEGTYDLTDRFSVTLGARWTAETRKTVANYHQGGVQSVINNRAEASFDDVSPRATLRYQPSPNLMTYFTYSRGFKSGGFNHRFAIPPPPFTQLQEPTRFDPEHVDLFEVGLKKDDLFDGRMRLNTSLFHSNYTDIQVVVFDLGIPRTINAAKARIRGGELEIDFLPNPRWALSLGYGYLDARYTRLDENVPGAFGNPIAIVPITTDTRFVNTPEHSLILGAEYAYPVGGRGTLNLRADASLRSEVANDAANTPELIQDSLWLLRTRATWVPRGASWELSVFGTNLTDATYITSGAADSPGYGIAEATFARRREWGVTLTYKFQSQP